MGVEPQGTSWSEVVDALFEHRSISRSNLAEASGLSRSSITEVIQGLLERRILEELPVVREGKQRGRPSVLLSFRAEHGFFLGVSITDRRSFMVLTDFRGEIVAECELSFHAEAADVAYSIQKGLTRLLQATGVARNKVLGVGAAVTGIVDQSTGDCRHSAALNWRDVPIGALVQQATGIKTFIDNDANTMAIGQKLFGRGREFKHYSSLILGRTIGCAHFINNRLYRGHDGGAGEIGHITLDATGPQCRCGKAGCLDMFAGGAALERAATEAGLKIETMRDLEAMAISGSGAAIAMLRRGGNALGLAVASLIQINNPQMVLFADVEGFGRGVFCTTARQTIENNILPRFLSTTQIEFQPIEQNFLGRGAASIAVHAYLHTLE